VDEVSQFRSSTIEEGFEMFRRKGLLSLVARGVAVATMAGLILTMAEPATAVANPVRPMSNRVSVTVPSAGTTDISARRRYYRRGNAAGLAIMGAMIGTIGGVIAAQQRRDAYYDYYNGYGPGYYGPPAYYGYGPYYGRRFYRYYPY
jgi:hypothetical protein